MIASRFALDKIVRNSASVANKFVFRGAAARCMSSNVEVEHGRGEWKTYGNLDNYEQGKYQIKTFNKISPVGLARFQKDNYDVRTGDDEAANAHAILMRSHKLQEDDVPTTVRAIARYVVELRTSTIVGRPPTKILWFEIRDGGDDDDTMLIFFCG